MNFIATVHMKDGHFYLGPDFLPSVRSEVHETLEGFKAGDDFYKDITHIYINEYDVNTSMPAETDPVWMWSKEAEAAHSETYPFTLDNGVCKTRKEAAKIVTARLPKHYDLAERKAAAAKVTSEEAGHDGCTVSYLVKSGWDALIETRLGF